MTTKINKSLVHQAKKDYKIETRLTYTPFDGGKGWIIVIKSLK